MSSRGAWAILLVSAVLEAVWATALGTSDGLSRPWPTALFAASCAASMYGLGAAMKRVPTGTAYAVWTGVGSLITVAWAMATGAEAASVLKVVLLAVMIACVAGLKLAEGAPASVDDAEGEARLPSR